MTPDAAGAQAPGTLGRRFAARLIDAGAVALVGVPLGLLLDFGPGWLLLQAGLVYGYFVVLDVSWGTTLGKQLVGLRVTGPQGGRPTVQQAAVREAFTIVGSVPYVGPLLALVAWIVIAVTINASPTRQGKHDDLAGGTRVVVAP